MLKYWFVALLALMASPATTTPTELSPAAKEVFRRWGIDSKTFISLAERDQALRKDLAAELDHAEPSWPRIQRLLVELQRNEAKTQNELRRRESRILKELSPPDRIAYLRSRYRRQETKPPIVIRVGPAERKP
jgi:hypothetical protein